MHAIVRFFGGVQAARIGVGALTLSAVAGSIALASDSSPSRDDAPQIITERWEQPVVPRPALMHFVVLAASAEEGFALAEAMRPNMGPADTVELVVVDDAAERRWLARSLAEAAAAAPLTETRPPVQVITAGV